LGGKAKAMGFKAKAKAKNLAPAREHYHYDLVHGMSSTIMIPHMYFLVKMTAYQVAKQQ